MKKINLEPQDKLRRIKTAIVMSDSRMSLYDIIKQDESAFSGFRILYASDFSGTPVQQTFRVNNTNIAVKNIFCGSSFLAYSDEINKQMLKGKADLQFPLRMILDTNVLSDLKSFFTDEDCKKKEKIRDTLEFMFINMRKSYDFSFAALENVRELSKPGNPWPYEKIIIIKTIEACNTLDEAIEKYASYNGCYPEKLVKEVDNFWELYSTSKEIIQAFTRRDLVYCLLLKTFINCWHGKSIHQNISDLVDFCLDNFSLIPMKEIYFSWKISKGFINPLDRLSIFDEPEFKSPKKNSASRVSALAWDLFMFRWCETLMTETKGSTFFIPAITTFDNTFSQAFDLCPLRAIIFNEKYGLVDTVFDDEHEFQIYFNDSLSEHQFARIQDPSRRSSKPYVSKMLLSKLIYELEGSIKNMC